MNDTGHIEMSDYTGKNLVFVVGCPRSGTTWLQRLLMCHPQIHSGQESNVFDMFVGQQLKMWKVLMTKKEGRPVGLPAYFKESEYKKALKSYMMDLLKPMIENLPDSDLFLEKTPRHALYLDEIIEMLPDAKIVYILRDVRDVVASLVAAGRGWGKSWASSSVEKSAKTWVQYIEAVNQFRKNFPAAHFHEIRYEELNSPSGPQVLRGIFQFLELQFSDEQIIEAIENNRIEKAKAELSAGTPIPVFGEFRERFGSVAREPEGFCRKGKNGAWREDLTESDLEIIYKIAGDYLREDTISVVIPTYNREKLIVRAIQSVQSQTVPVNEIIVVDDISTDATAEVINSMVQSDSRIKYVKLEKKGGAQAARNAGIRAASGRWIAFLDSDDEWLPDRIKHSLEIARQTGADVIYTNFIKRQYKEGQLKDKLMNPGRFEGSVLNDILKKSFVSFPGLLVKKECLISIGYLDEAITSWQEWDTAIRLAERYSFGFVPEPVFIWNWHEEDAISKDNYREAIGYCQIVEKHREKIIRYAGGGILLQHYMELMKKFKNLNDFAQFQKIKNEAEFCLCHLKNGHILNTVTCNNAKTTVPPIFENKQNREDDPCVVSHSKQQVQNVLHNTAQIKQKAKPAALKYKYKNTKYISAEETINNAKSRGMSILDYIEDIWNHKGLTKRIVDTIGEIIGSQKIDSICEIGPGTGRYMGLYIDKYNPSMYHYYETAEDWNKYLADAYRSKVQPKVADGRSLAETADDSCDLVVAHGVFVCLSSVNSFEYFKEMSRVCKKNGFIVFDIYSDRNFDPDIVDKWMERDVSFQIILPEQNIIQYFSKYGVAWIHSFDNNHRPNPTKYLVFKKTADVSADKYDGHIKDMFHGSTVHCIQDTSLISAGNH